MGSFLTAAGSRRRLPAGRGTWTEMKSGAGLAERETANACHFQQLCLESESARR
jgi:hypothetical protein